MSHSFLSDCTDSDETPSINSRSRHHLQHFQYNSPPSHYFTQNPSYSPSQNLSSRYSGLHSQSTYSSKTSDFRQTKPSQEQNPIPLFQQHDIDEILPDFDQTRDLDLYTMYSQRNWALFQKKSFISALILHVPVIFLVCCFGAILFVAYQAFQFNYTLHHDAVVVALEFENNLLSNHLKRFSAIPASLLTMLRQPLSDHQTATADNDSISKQTVEAMIRSLIADARIQTPTTSPSSSSSSSSTPITHSDDADSNRDDAIYENEFKQAQILQDLLSPYHDHPIGILNEDEKSIVSTMIYNHLNAYQSQRDEFIDVIYDKYDLEHPNSTSHDTETPHNQNPPSEPPLSHFKSLCDTTNQHVNNLLVQLHTNIITTSRCLRHSDCIRFVSPIRCELSHSLLSSKQKNTMPNFNCPFALHYSDEQLTFDISNSINHLLCNQWYSATCTQFQPIEQSDSPSSITLSATNHSTSTTTSTTSCPKLHPVRCVNHVCSVINESTRVFSPKQPLVTPTPLIP